MKNVSSKISAADAELLRELGYTTGQAIREFCSLKRQTNLKMSVNRDEITKKLEETEQILTKAQTEKTDLMSQLKILDADDEETKTALTKGDSNECKRIAASRLFEKRREIQRRDDGYEDIIKYCISTMPNSGLTVEGIKTFFENYGKKVPPLGEIEFLVY